MRVLPRLFKLWPWIDLDLFYIKVKFGYIGFFMGESVFFFLETIAALGLKVAWSIQLNELMKLNEYQRSRSFFDLGQMHSDFTVKCLTLACILRWAIQGFMALLFSSSERSSGKAIALPLGLALALAKCLSSPEHEVLIVSYCDQSLSVFRRPCVVNFLL